MSEKERVAIFVDGSNMYHYVKEMGLTNLLQFDYKQFTDHLSRGRQVISSTYYIGKMREQVGDIKSRIDMANQQRLISRLQKFGWHISFGHMLIDGGGKREKGVDVQIAIDLLRGAYKDTYDVAILVSSDTDLIPAVDEIKTEGKKLEYVGFSHRPSFGLIKHANLTNTLTKEVVTSFLP